MRLSPDGRHCRGDRRGAQDSEGRLRGLAVTPDGALLVTTSNGEHADKGSARSLDRLRCATTRSCATPTPRRAVSRRDALRATAVASGLVLTGVEVRRWLRRRRRAGSSTLTHALSPNFPMRPGSRHSPPFVTSTVGPRTRVTPAVAGLLPSTREPTSTRPRTKIGNGITVDRIAPAICGAAGRHQHCGRARRNPRALLTERDIADFREPPRTDSAWVAGGAYTGWQPAPAVPTPPVRPGRGAHAHRRGGRSRSGPTRCRSTSAMR